MKPLVASEVVPLWERGQEQSPGARAVSALVAACPELDETGAAELPIGEFQSRLLSLWELTFGPRIDGYVECPACSEQLELPLRADELRSSNVPGMAAETLKDRDWVLTFRPLRWEDLIAASAANSPASGRALLIERCVIAARRDQEDRPASELPAALVAALAERLEAADPAAEIRIDLACPACDHRWWAELDVSDFLWAELSIHARRLLLEVHALARAYGWCESDILGLSPPRRRFYLDEVWG